MDELCRATLRHAHGLSRCTQELGHSDEHSGRCSLCWEDGDDEFLYWTDLDEDWTTPGGKVRGG